MIKIVLNSDNFSELDFLNNFITKYNQLKKCNKGIKNNGIITIEMQDNVIKLFKVECELEAERKEYCLKLVRGLIQSTTQGYVVENIEVCEV